MTHHSLGFGQIIILQPDIAEVIINDGIEMDESMVDDYHHFLIEHLVAPFSILVNKIHAYTYTFEAQLKLCTIPQIHSMAVVTYSHISEVATDSLNSIPRTTPWNLRKFPQREQALGWLIQNQDTIRNKDGKPSL
ncbi:MAG TPA: hypothetical protein VIQ03_09330 [Gammaproteobacteria bacterium]